MSDLRLITEFDNGLKLMYNDDIDQYCLSDDYLSDWIIFYDNIDTSRLWAVDGLFEFTQEMILYLNTIGLKKREYYLNESNGQYETYGL